MFSECAIGWYSGSRGGFHDFLNVCRLQLSGQNVCTFIVAFSSSSAVGTYSCSACADTLQNMHGTISAMLQQQH